MYELQPFLPVVAESKPEGEELPEGEEPEGVEPEGEEPEGEEPEGEEPEGEEPEGEEPTRRLQAEPESDAESESESEQQEVEAEEEEVSSSETEPNSEAEAFPEWYDLRGGSISKRFPVILSTAVNAFLPVVLALMFWGAKPPATTMRIELSSKEWRDVTLRRALVFASVLLVLGCMAGAQIVINGVEYFQNDRVAFCVIVYGTNAITLFATKKLGHWLLSKPTCRADRDSDVVTLQVIMTIVNSLLALLYNAAKDIKGFQSTVQSDPLAVNSSLRTADLAAAELFGFLWLSFLGAQGVRWGSDIAQTMLPSSVRAILPKPSDLYGSREQWSLLLLGFAF